MNIEANLEILQAGLLTISDIMNTDWPEPIWAIPGILPVGLTILAGRPKVGKSWLALQIALSVATGGMVFDRKVEKGPVLCIALEDSPRRLKKRTETQGWPRGNVPVSFIGTETFMRGIGNLQKVGVVALTELIRANAYKLVIIDTLSRALGCKADQLDVGAMTTILSPLQEMAQELNIAILMIDHHRKPGINSKDVLDDLLGSTAKGAVADTIWGLYKERGKAGATLAITGRDIEEQELSLKVDWQIGCWQCEATETKMGLVGIQLDVWEILEELGPSKVGDISEALGKNRGSIYKELQELIKNGWVKRDDMGYGKTLYVSINPTSPTFQHLQRVQQSNMLDVGNVGSNERVQLDNLAGYMKEHPNAKIV